MRSVVFGKKSLVICNSLKFEPNRNSWSIASNQTNILLTCNTVFQSWTVKTLF